MFFYLSFLRPPPTKAPLSSPLLITPQISNDLRTEPCDSNHDLYYDWIRVDDGTETRSAVVQTRRANMKKPTMTKLMTFKNENAYKEVPVPPPPNVREGQQWRLILAAAEAPSASAARSALPPSTGRILLDDERIGSWSPFSVSSMPVTFTYWARGAPKQEEIERTYEFKIGDLSGTPASSPDANPSLDAISNKLKGLRIEEQKEISQGKSRAVRLIIREQTSFDLDKKIWDSGIGLSSWLIQWTNRRWPTPRAAQNNPEVATAVTRLKDALTSEDALKILELGAGTGIVAIAMAALRSRIADAEDYILTTDLDTALPLLDHNIESNASALSPKITLKTGVLDWDEDLADQLADQKSFDIVVMADVAYNTDSFSALVKVLEGLQNLDTAKKPAFLLGYKQRDEAERTLWALTEAVGIKLVQIGSVPGHVSGSAPIEIWANA